MPKSHGFCSACKKMVSTKMMPSVGVIACGKCENVMVFDDREDWLDAEADRAENWMGCDDHEYNDKRNGCVYCGLPENWGEARIDEHLPDDLTVEDGEVVRLE